MNSPYDEMLPIFIDELNERLVRMSDALLALEAHNKAGTSLGREVIEGFFRDAHSIKGTAMSLELNDLGALAHAIEGALTPARSGGRLVPGVVDRAVRALETMRATAEILAKEGFAGTTSHAMLKAAAEELKSGSPAGPATSAAPATASPPHADPPEAPAIEEAVRVSRKHLERIDRTLDELRILLARAPERRQAFAELAKAFEEIGGRTKDRAAQHDLWERLNTVQNLLGEAEHQIAKNVRELEDGLRAFQLVPLGAMLEPLLASVRRLGHLAQKTLAVTVEGGDLQIDRRLFESIKDPLIHIFRNAVDHGIESPDERKRAGKEEVGTLRIRAEQVGEKVIIETIDDGRGIDRARIQAVAVERGLISAEVAARLSEADTISLIFRPGFSTAGRVTETSGRGVGLDVVANALLHVGGRVELESVPGRGTTLRLSCPLTLISEQVFLVEVSGRRTAILMSAVERIALIRAGEVARIGGEPILNVDGREIRLMSLAAALGIPEWDAPRDRFPALILRSRQGAHEIALRADRVIGVQEAMIKPLPQELNGLAHLSSVADVGEGRLVFVFNHDLLFRGRPASVEERDGSKPSTILVVDDSVTTRALHRRVLEGAGYRVLVATSGLEALRILETERADLIVSDVDMPQLDGVSMLERIRASPRLTGIPAILASALTADSQRIARAKGLADAYIAKSAYDRGEMIETIQRLLAKEGR